MKEVLIATNNLGKAKDFDTLFKPFGVRVLTLNDLDEPIDVEETGVTFEDNAILKAETVARLLNKIVIADDSGLEIDALDGAPGVYSARYAGPEKNDGDNIDKVLKELAAVPTEGRTARFRCVLAVAGPGIQTETFSGSCEGLIHTERKGTNGFGYDPIFYVPEQGRMMAELSPEEKSLISHRGAALAQLKVQLPQFMESVGDHK
ncbi:XTP/dITP diphosphatase [Sporosarcina sp. NPDC096371]|uniref:XTP/dITP diphosphatase n=1 Tax=Sporosarcina sp. NPDC096371 TaxID=3364530 RepID=UPI00381A2242